MRLPKMDSTNSATMVASEVIDKKAARRRARKAMKAKRRAKREGRLEGEGQKKCTLCKKSVDLLVRCQLDDTATWHMVCGTCWNLPSVSGGVPDGDGKNTHYRYGGLWKNLHKM